MKIGFIGLGVMGRPMALNLQKAGHELLVSGHNPERAAELVAGGATMLATPREIASQADVVITMLPNSPQVEEVALGEDGIAAGAHDGLVLIDMSSIAPLAARQIHDRLADAGVAMIDAPVSGGEPKAVEGTLAVMVGGDSTVVDTVRPLLEPMAASVTHVGEIGSGNTAKLANQVVVALNIAALAESLVLAQKAGVDPAAVVDAIRGGLAGSTVMEAKAPMMLEHHFEPGFRIDLHIKDLLNALATGHDVEAPLPLTASVLEMMTSLAAHGNAHDDHSALLRHYETLSGSVLGEN